MTKPIEDYTWAVNPVAEVKSNGTGGSVIVLNKEEPDVATQESGIPVNGMLARGFYNYVIRALGVHIDYLYQGEVGDSFTTFNTATTATQVPPLRASTWAAVVVVLNVVKLSPTSPWYK